MQSDDEKNEGEVLKKHQQMLYKISYTDDPESLHPRKYKYSNESIQPFVYFYKLLAFKPCEKKHKNQLILNLPDTVVFNDGDNPVMWLYTNEKGEVARIDNVPYYQITSKFTEGSLEKELVAVIKKPSYGYSGPSGNDVKVISASEIKTVLSLVLSQRTELSIIQKYVKSKSVKPSIVRTCWRQSGFNQSWTLNSNFEYTSKAKVPQISKFIVNTKNVKNFRAIKNVSDKFTSETLKYVKNIVDFVSRNLKVKFKEFVCDFIKDEGGNWWFINVKAFILETQGKINLKPITMHDDEMVDSEGNEIGKKKLESYTKCKKCSYCYKILAEHLMTHKLTLMMILQCDQHLTRMGKSFPWLQRCYQQHVSSVNLYIEHKVCDSCYRLYIEVQKMVELEIKMAKIIGVSVKSDNRNAVSITAIPSFKGHSPQFGSRFQKVKYDTEMPQNWGLPQNQQIMIGLENESSKMVNKCRFMIFVHGLRDIPTQYLTNGKQYSLSYSFLNQRVSYKIDIENKSEPFEEMLRVAINKMKVIYFFSEKRDNITSFLKSHPLLKICLHEGKQLMGCLELELDDFKSDKVIKKDYFKMFSGPKIFPYLSWGLFISVGLHEGQCVETNSLKLIRQQHLLLPGCEYHSPDLLPEQWIEMINDKQDVSLSQASMIQSDIDSSKTKSQFAIKDKVDIEVEDYERRRVISHGIRRKAYY